MRIRTLSANALVVAVLAALLASGGQPPALPLVSSAAAQPARSNDPTEETATLPDYFAAPQLEVLSSSDRSIAFRQTYPDGSTREVSYVVEPGHRHVISDDERAAARADGRSVYRVNVSQPPYENGSLALRVEFFVPYDELPAELRDRFQPAAALNWLTLLGITDARAQAAGTGGVSVILSETFKEAAEQAFGQVTEWRGAGQPLSAALSAFLDIKEANELAKETDAYLKRLDELEDCAKNPTHQVPVSAEERQKTLDTLARIRADLRQVTMVRFLTIVADYPLGLTQKAGGPVAGLVGAGLSVALKPFAQWSNDALQSFIKNTLMREAEAAVVPCTEECEDEEDEEEAEPAPQAVSGRPAPSATTGSAPRAATPTATRATPAAAPRTVSLPQTPAKQCQQNRVTVRLRKVDRYADLSGFGYSDHRQAFWGTTTVAPSPFGDLDGTGTGSFRESADVVVYDWCHRRVRSAVEATMTVKILPDLGEVQVGITSDRLFPSDELDEREPNNPQCMTFTNTEPGPELNLGCTFDNVDLENGGYYADPENYVYVDDDDDNLYQCILRLGGPEEDPPPPEPDPPPRPPSSPRMSGVLPGGTPSGAPTGAAAGAADAMSRAPQAAPPQQSGDSNRSGTYRATLLGLRSTAPTVDTPANADGAGDEVFAFGAAVVWDRDTSSVRGALTARTQTYRAIVANGAAPADFDPGRAAAAAPTNEAFPLLVWEGPLTAGGEAVIIVPSVWERDGQAQVFEAYQRAWQNPSSASLASEPVVGAGLASTFLTVATAGLPNDVAGRSVAIPTQGGTNGEDRPIGIGAVTEAGAIYPERYIAVTWENVAHLTVGEGTTVTVPLQDVDSPRFGGNYALYVRIQRIQ